MLSTSYAPLRKYYRIQSSSLLALNNPKSIYPACSNNRGAAPACLSGLPRQASSLIPRMAERRQDLAERGCSKALPRVRHSSCSSLPAEPQVPSGTVLLNSKVPVQGTSTAAATLDPKVHSYLHPATCRAIRESHLYSQMRTTTGKHSLS